MIIYKNLRDIEELVDKCIDNIRLSLLRGDYTAIKAKVDVYESGGILRWYKPKFIKTIDVIKIIYTWRDFDNEHLPLDGAEWIEGLYNEYLTKKLHEENEQRILDRIRKYK